MRKYILSLAPICFLVLTFIPLREVNAKSDSLQSRLIRTINSDWEFVYRGKKRENPNKIQKLDSSEWKSIRLPHTWNKDDAFDEEAGYDRGIGWYRKELRLPSKPAKSRHFLHFEGANQITDLYINGTHIKRHVGGYTAFTADVTEALHKQGENSILVRVDNRHNPDVPPLNADFTFYGGIYRDVELWSVNPVHFSVDTAYGSPGIKVQTPKVSEESGNAVVSAGLSNATRNTESVRVKAGLYSPQGELVKEKTIDTGISGTSSETVSFDFNLTDPQLWSPEHPNLYRVELKLYRKNQLSDVLQTNFGFRYFSFDPDKGLILNGKVTSLRGTNRHQDYPGRGNALPDAFHRRDMKIIKKMGANYVRLAHYPQDPAVLNAADRQGLLVWEETPIVNYITQSRAFTKHSKRMLREMIRQHYNHPSVMLWGYMNEILLFNEKGEFGETEDSSYVRHLRNLTKELDQIAQQEDSTRYTAMAMHYSDVYDRTGLAGIPDVVGWNLYFGWYYENFDDLGRFLDKQHEEYPERVLTISEYGAGSDLRVHAQRPQSFDFTNEFQNRIHESYLAQIEKRDYLAATAIWNQFDFGSQSRGDTRPHINQKGVMTFERQPKDAYYNYKAHWSDKPVLHINGGSWSKMVASETSIHDTLVVYSNMEKVKLYQNGNFLGERSPDGQHMIRWPVQLKEGHNRFLATSETEKGEKVVSRRKTELISAKPQFTTGSRHLNVGSSYQFIDAADQLWIPDDLDGGDWKWVSGETGKVSSEIIGTGKEPIYQTYRSGMQGFKYDLDKGTYEVKLLFLEPEYKKPGRRVFDVKINGTTVARGLDLADMTGYQTSYSFHTNAKIGERDTLNIKFDKIQGEPVISGISIRKVD